MMWDIFLYAANVLLLLVDELSCFDLWQVKIKVGTKAKTEYTQREKTLLREMPTGDREKRCQGIAGKPWAMWQYTD